MVSSPSLILQMSTLSFSLTLIFILISITASNAALTKTDLINQILEGHNSARKLVGVPPLKWDTLLSTYARVYSNQRRKDCKLVHSPGIAFGENLFWGQGKHWLPKEAVAEWIAEKKWYHYNNNSCTGKMCSHYTQIVWRNTERVGCAKIICESGDSYIACEYYPPGNYIGVRPY